jgi:hypothetical protein
MRAMCSVTGERAVKDFNPHDIRRTVATRIAELLGVGGDQLIRRVLGHADGSVTAIYNRYGYVKEMRTALEQWVEELARELSAEPYVVQAQEVALSRPVGTVFPARAAWRAGPGMRDACALLSARCASQAWTSASTQPTECAVILTRRGNARSAVSSYIFVLRNPVISMT